ncbi:MAG: HD domain-containing protein [Thermomicrobiales bacterium]
MPTDIAIYLRPGTIERFRALMSADQRHLLAVGQRLRADGACTDLWVAGLLHDLGKTYQGHHVRLLDRGLWVIAAHVPPIARRIRRQATMPRIGSGIWIAAHHAALGNAMLRELGYNERICTLVALHEDDELAAVDPDLAQLRAADNAPSAIPTRKTSIVSSTSIRAEAHVRAS